MWNCKQKKTKQTFKNNFVVKIIYDINNIVCMTVFCNVIVFINLSTKIIQL